jgi:hypothetical protein
VPGDPELADVDHFIPWAARNEVGNINGVWNLVLACQCCNRGVEGKSARIPKVRLLERLHTRNEYFIQSKLPLHETIVQQTGANPTTRIGFLQRNWQAAGINSSIPGNPKLKARQHFNDTSLLSKPRAGFFDGTVNVI